MVICCPLVEEHRVKEAFINVHLVLCCCVHHAEMGLLATCEIEVSHELRVIPLLCIFLKHNRLPIGHPEGVKAAAPDFSWHLEHISLDNESVLVCLRLHIGLKLHQSCLQMLHAFWHLASKVLNRMITGWLLERKNLPSC